MKTSIIYNSHHGTTKAYAEELGKFLSEKGINNQVASIDDYDEAYLKSADMVLLGCWTSGLFFFAQHPDKAWKQFAKEMPSVKGKKVGMFTTYKLATGSMFRKMEAKISDKIDGCELVIRSKSKLLTEENKKQLEELIA